MAKELVSTDTPNLEEEAKKRQFLQQSVAYPYFVAGYLSGFADLVLGGTSRLVPEATLVGLASMVCSVVLFQIFSKINTGKVGSINEELDLRKGQLRFWDNNAAIRPILEL